MNNFLFEYWMINVCHNRKVWQKRFFIGKFIYGNENWLIWFTFWFCEFMKKKEAEFSHVFLKQKIWNEKFTIKLFSLLFCHFLIDWYWGFSYFQQIVCLFLFINLNQHQKYENQIWNHFWQIMKWLNWISNQSRVVGKLLKRCDALLMGLYISSSVWKWQEVKHFVKSSSLRFYDWFQIFWRLELFSVNNNCSDIFYWQLRHTWIS